MKDITLHRYYTENLEEKRPEDSDCGNVGLNSCTPIDCCDKHQYTVTMEAEAERLVVELTELRQRDGAEPRLWELTVETEIRLIEAGSTELIRVQAETTEEERILDELATTLELEVSTSCSYSVEVAIFISTNTAREDSHIKVIHTQCEKPDPAVGREIVPYE